MIQETHLHVSRARQSEEASPLVQARQKLFPPLRNKLLSQAANALADNRPDIAEPIVSKFLERNPTEPAALNLLADIERRARRFEEAKRLLARCVAVSPGSAGYRFNYAVILRQLGSFADALAQLEELLATDPQNPLYHDVKASILRRMGCHGEALAICKALTEQHPRSVDLWLEYADSLRNAGLGSECVAALQKVLELAPSSIPAYLQLANLKTYRFTREQITRMAALLAQPNVPAEDRADLHFALGKAYSDEALPAQAFENYAKGNALKRPTSAYDVDGLVAYRKMCEQVFSKDFFAERVGWGACSKAPIFIVGMPRSGSTLVEQILSSHSAIEGLGELADLDSTVGRKLSTLEGNRDAHEFWIGGHFEFQRGLSESLPLLLRSMDESTACALGEGYLQAIARHRLLSSARFTDKGLRNFGYVGLIKLILPNSRIIDVRRNPLDCAWSCFRSDFPGGQPFAHRLVDIGRVYAEYFLLMKHFDRVMPQSIHRVQYEDLVVEPAGEIRRLLDYLGLPLEEQCERFYENSRTVKTLSSEQVRIPLYGSGVGQWRPYEKWLAPLKAALGGALEDYSNP